MEIAGHIGTPLAANATKVLLLGSGELGKGLALAFQQLGVEVHAVDRYAGAPAHQVAHHAHIADICDAAQVLELSRRIEPDYVIPEVEMVAVEALKQIEAETAATVVPSARACELTQDRANVRACAESIGLPVSSYSFATTLADLESAVEELGYPCIVKPDVTTSGKGHMVVREHADIESAWNLVHRVSPSQQRRVVAERFVDFDYEATILAVRSIDPATGKLATWFSEPIGHEHHNGDLVESWQPMAMSEVALENARSVAARISNELGGRGVFGVEIFVAGDDVYFSSVSPRPSDTAMLTARTQRFSQFEAHARAILGYPIDVTLVSPGASVVLHAEHKLADVAYTGLEHAYAYAETDVQLFGKPRAYKGRRMGLVTVTAETVEEARDKAALAASKVEVVPTPGTALPASAETLDIDYRPADLPKLNIIVPEANLVEVDPVLVRSADQP